MARIIIKRSSEWNNKAREIGIYINGKKRGTIDDGEVKEYEIEQGSHEVFAKIDWCYSPKIKVKVDENQTKILKLSGFKYGTKMVWVMVLLPLIYFVLLQFNIDAKFFPFIMLIAILYPIYYITFGRKRYLVLEE